MHRYPISLKTHFFSVTLLATMGPLSCVAQEPAPVSTPGSSEKEKNKDEKRMDNFLKSLLLSPKKKSEPAKAKERPSEVTDKQESDSEKPKTERPQGSDQKPAPQRANTQRANTPPSRSPGSIGANSSMTAPSFLAPLNSLNLGSQLGSRKVCTKCGKPMTGRSCTDGNCGEKATGSADGNGKGSGTSKGTADNSSVAGSKNGGAGQGSGPSSSLGQPGASLLGGGSQSSSGSQSNAGNSNSMPGKPAGGPDSSGSSTTAAGAAGSLPTQSLPSSVAGPDTNTSPSSQLNGLQPSMPQGHVPGPVPVPGTAAVPGTSPVPGTGTGSSPQTSGNYPNNNQIASDLLQAAGNSAVFPFGFGGGSAGGSGLSDLLNTPVPINDPNIRGMLDTASGMMVPQNWEVVQPSGVGASDSPFSLGMNESQVSGASDADEAKVLDGGTLKMAIQTGPKNPLILPADIASVVYVVDGSGSMSGEKFRRVSAALVDAVQQMEPHQKFSVICFNTLAIRPRGIGYRHATAEVAAQLSMELSAVTPVGGTDPTDALLIALQLRPKTVVILSDGEFERRVIDRVSHLNRSSGLNCQINCIAIGTSAKTLKRLATLNGPGNYVEAK